MHFCDEVEIWDSHALGSSSEHEMATWLPSVTKGGPVQSPHDARRTKSVPRCESRSTPILTDKRTWNALELGMAQRVNTITEVTISLRMRRKTYVEWQTAIVLVLTGGERLDYSVIGM